MSDISAKQQLDESLSALVDGEISELELRRLLKADDNQFADMRGRWASYQAISSSAKKDTPEVPFIDLSASISAAIAEEAAPIVSKPVVKKRFWSDIGRFAVAASVAGAVVLGVQFAPSNLDNQVADSTVPVEQVKVPSSFENGLPEDTTVRTVSTTPIKKEERAIVITEATKQQLKQAEDQVNRLMLEHAQNASQNTQQGILPFTRVPESSEN